MTRRTPAPALLSLSCALLACTGCVPFIGRRSAQPGEPTARVVSFRGWRGCVRLDNGLVRATSVPQIGGRTLEYSLEGYNPLFIGRSELGAVVDDARPYRHFGGHFVQLHPEDQWRRLQAVYPASLFTGRYEARVVEGADGAAAVEMTSPLDPATATQVVRRVELFPNSTRLRITDTLANLRPVAQRWGLHDFLQLKGVSEPSGVLRGDEQARGDIRLYVPVNPKSRHRGGVAFAVPVADGDPQWSTSLLPGLLVLRYRGRLGKALVDPVLPWVAFADHATGHVFVQRCAAPGKAVMTAGGGYALIEVQSFAPASELPPRGTAVLEQEWFVARCPGPVVDVTDAGVVCSPLTLLRGDDGVWAAGTFGVFYLGGASLVLRDSKGGELARFDCGLVHPSRVLKLNQRITLPAGTAEAVLEIRSLAGKPVGHLGRILLGSAP